MENKLYTNLYKACSEKAKATYLWILIRLLCVYEYCIEKSTRYLQIILNSIFCWGHHNFIVHLMCNFYKTILKCKHLFRL